MIACDIDAEGDVLNMVAYHVIAHAVNLFKIPEDIRIIVHGESLDDGTDALTGPIDDGFAIILNAKETWTEQKVAEIVGHEMVHIKQYVHDGLDLGENNTAKFRNKYYRTWNETEYWLAPWEIEARGYQYYFLWNAIRKGHIS